MRVSFKQSLVLLTFFISMSVSAVRAEAQDLLPDYMNAVDGISIDSIRSSAKQIWLHGLNPKNTGPMIWKPRTCKELV